MADEAPRTPAARRSGRGRSGPWWTARGVAEPDRGGRGRELVLRRKALRRVGGRKGGGSLPYLSLSVGAEARQKGRIEERTRAGKGAKGVGPAKHPRPAQPAASHRQPGHPARAAPRGVGDAGRGPLGSRWRRGRCGLSGLHLPTPPSPSAPCPLLLAVCSSTVASRAATPRFPVARPTPGNSPPPRARRTRAPHVCSVPRCRPSPPPFPLLRVLLCLRDRCPPAGPAWLALVGWARRDEPPPRDGGNGAAFPPDASLAWQRELAGPKAGRGRLFSGLIRVLPVLGLVCGQRSRRHASSRRRARRV